MNNAILVGIALSYFPGMLIVLRLIGLAQKKLVVDRKMAKMPRGKSASAQDLPKQIWPIWKERLGFTLKDGRPSKAGPPNRILFFLIVLAGLAIVLLAAFSQFWKLLIIGYPIFFGAVILSFVTAKPIIETRKTIIKRMFDVGASQGVLDREHADNPAASVKILEWEEFITPVKVEYQVRTEFSSGGEESFMQQFNQIFGMERTWVPSDDLETGAPGWNYNEGVVTLHAVPPLPQMAPWHERYVRDPGIAWSFFPIALGVENGVEIPNPDTGEIENVLGFDLSGEQVKAGKAAGYKVSPSITASPMVLIGGGTGGGKSLASDTIVEVFKK